MKVFLIIILTTIFFSQNSIAQNVGIGTTSPGAKLHIVNGASGYNSSYFPGMVIEGNTNTYLNFLTPGGSESAVLFGKASDASSGGIVYNNPGSLNGFQFRTNGNLTRMTIANNGNIGIGLLSANASLSVSSTGSELIGTAASPTFRTHAGSLGTAMGNEINLGSIGFSSANNSSLGIRAYRHTAGSDWTSTSLVLGYDVDNTIRAGGFLSISSNSNIGIGTPTPQAKLHVYAGDGSLGLFGPSNFGGQLYIGAGPNQNLAQTAQVLSPDGGLYIDPASDRNICLGCNQSRDIFINPYGGKVTIGSAATPVYPLDVKGNLFRAGNFENTSTSQDYEGVSGSCITTPNFGTGVSGYGGRLGVFGTAVFGGTGDRFGVLGDGRNGSGTNYGVYAYASGGATAIGLYATGGNASALSLAAYFVGTTYATGFYTGSDRKLKNDVSTLYNALSIIKQLNPSVYTFKTGEYKQMNLPEGLQYGLIADEVQDVIPAIVKKIIQPAQFENNNGQGKKISDKVEFNAINYMEIIPILIAAVKEQQIIIEDLKMRNDKSEQQQKQIDDLKLLVEKLLKQ